MEIENLLRDVNIENGREVSIHCYFMMKSGVGYLSDKLDIKATYSNCIYVNHPDLEKKLLSDVPAYAGGGYSYFNECEISGTVYHPMHSEFLLAIKNLTSFVILTHGFRIAVNL